MIDWIGSLESLGYNSRDINWDEIQYHDLDILTNLGYIANLFYDAYVRNPKLTKFIIKKIFISDLYFTKYDFDEYPWLSDFLNVSNDQKNIPTKVINLDPLLEFEHEQSIEEYILKGESYKLEFKSTLKWDIDRGEFSRDREKDVCKAICGFLNFKGGVLLIGVGDDGSILGIEKDLENINRHDRDGFQQRILQIIEKYLGNQFIPYIAVDFNEKDQKTVCIVKVLPSKKPVFLKYNNNEYFYIRAGNTTRALKFSEMHEYTKHHWL